MYLTRSREVAPASSPVRAPVPPVGHNGLMMTPTDPARYAGVDLRLAAVDMDGTLLDDDKNFPRPGWMRFST